MTSNDSAFEIQIPSDPNKVDKAAVDPDQALSADSDNYYYICNPKQGQLNAQITPPKGTTSTYVCQTN